MKKPGIEERQQLIETARQARRWAYAPYSQYAVGAAVLTASGRVYDGVNIENAAYPTGICAERVAVFKAVSEGEREFVAIAVVTSNAGSPCGSCRQVLAEFGTGTIVYLADEEGNLQVETTVANLLPFSFGPGDLPKV
ncbi:MAG TPA: cytidine deaminase [Anaerolineaceae bacterium]|nr:cytidine deaminase [Anaerolineaceae bacterium]HQO97492.1 cytidine deaminase [Anaerolineaceae bacterium]HQP61183.1 cytidine deaminase [Anaerolineaceae bacterium]